MIKLLLISILLTVNSMADIRGFSFVNQSDSTIKIVVISEKNKDKYLIKLQPKRKFVICHIQNRIIDEKINVIVEQGGNVLSSDVSKWISYSFGADKTLGTFVSGDPEKQIQLDQESEDIILFMETKESRFRVEIKK